MSEDNNIEPSAEILNFVDTIYNEFKNIVKSFDINVTNFILVVTKCIERVDNIYNLESQDKYIVAVLVLDKIIDDVLEVNENDKYYLHNIIPSLIEIVIDASKGRLKLNIKHIKKVKHVEITQIIDDLYRQIKNMIEEDNYSVEYICTNIIVIVGMLMTAVERYPDLTGIEKKSIVIRVINKLIDEICLKYPNLDPALKLLIEQAKIMIPNVIDMLVSISLENFKINVLKIKDKIIKIFACCKKDNLI